MSLIGMMILGLGLVGGCRGAQKDQAGEDQVSGTPEASVDSTGDEASQKTYFSNHDPDAVYTMADLPREGSYLKLDFSDLTPEQLNRVVHRLKTEYCTCGCVDDTIDECLVADPGCVTAVELAGMIKREEKANL